MTSTSIDNGSTTPSQSPRQWLHNPLAEPETMAPQSPRRARDNGSTIPRRARDNGSTTHSRGPRQWPTRRVRDNAVLLAGTRRARDTGPPTPRRARDNGPHPAGPGTMAPQPLAGPETMACRRARTGGRVKLVQAGSAPWGDLYRSCSPVRRFADIDKGVKRWASPSPWSLPSYPKSPGQSLHLAEPETMAPQSRVPINKAHPAQGALPETQ